MSESIPLPAANAFPDAWRRYVHDNVILFALLPESHQERLLQRVPGFIAGKFWEGCAGLPITDEIRVTIAAQACLLVLGFDNYCFDDLKTILVYPGGYLCVEPDTLGEQEYRGHHLGEAHHRGPVVLSWWHALWGGRHRGRENLVLHEFAHKLAESGDAERGLPPLDDAQDARRWERVLAAEYEQLVDDAERERPSLLDPYGATSRAEFFAVATECFFLQSRDMRQRHPELYELLAGWYRQDPAQWRSDAAIVARNEEAERQYLRHSIAECDAAIRQFPEDLEAYRQRAECYGELEEYDKALDDYTHLLEHVPKHERADAYYERGCVHLEANSLDAAIADFSEAIRRDRDIAEAYQARGSAYAMRGEHKKALADLNHALHLDPEDDAAYRWRGRVCRELGKYDKALRDLTRAIRLCPYLEENYDERAAVYEALGEHAKAKHDQEEALRLRETL
jgi:Mlc titration factor MtfA (ptsG expression regulator)/Tfp pilus assembly protein PilF